MLCQTAACDPNLPGANAITTPGKLQQMRTADANLRAEAQKIANQSDGTVVTSFSYSQGPDGRNYISAVTVTQTERVPQSEVVSPLSPSDKPQASEQSLNDLAPASLAVSPIDIAEALATRELQQADASVRAHEGLHFRAAGGVASGLPQYEYATGPDGQLYAVAGNVQVQTTATTDPDKAARDAATFAMAATAPGDASAQDLSAARSAYQNAAESFRTATNIASEPQSAPIDLFA